MPAGGWAAKENKDMVKWTSGNDVAVDRDGRSREARGRVLPTLISSSPGKSPAPFNQRPAVGRPQVPNPTGAPSTQALPRVGSGMEASRRVAHADYSPACDLWEQDPTHTHRRSTNKGTIGSLQEGNSMKEFLDFRRSSKEQSIEKLHALPERTQEMLRGFLYPATPDESQMIRRSRHRAGHNTPTIVLPKERVLHKRFQNFCRGSSMAVPKENKNQASDHTSDDDELSEAGAGPKKEGFLDLRGFIALMQHLGLIPTHKHGGPIPLQNALAIQCFKSVQQQFGRRTLNFHETKEVIYQFLRRGPDMLAKQHESRRKEIVEMRHKIARMVPNCEDPLREVKTVFSQLFDSVFDAFIFFDVSGDWTLTQNEFVQYCKMLQLPMTPADLQIAMYEQCQLEELDSISFVQCFKWYELVGKPKFRVLGYTVHPSENRLYQVFAWLASGCKPERILEMIGDLERQMHAAFAAEMEQEAHQQDALQQGEGGAGGAAPVAGTSTDEPGEVPQTRLLPVSESPNMSPTDRGGPSAAPLPALQGGKHKNQGKSAGSSQKRVVADKENLFFAEETRTVSDSSERAMTFQNFIDFLKVADLIPIHLHRPAGKMKADLSSAEFGEALRIFRLVLGKEKRLEWPEFKHCMHEMLTSRSLQKQLADAESKLLNMRNALSRYAPSTDKPLEALKDALSIRFNSSVEAFVYFDMQGDWSVSQAEVHNMIKRLYVGMSKPDLEAALQAIFIASHGGGINANEFVRRLKWSQDDVSKVKEVFDLKTNERRLFNEFVRWCEISNPSALASSEAGVPGSHPGSPLQSPTPASRRSSARIIEVDAGSRSGTASSKPLGASRPSTKTSADPISRLNTGVEMPPFHPESDAQEPEVRGMTSSARLPFEGFEGFLRAMRLLKSESAIDELQLQLARKAFESVNWTSDPANVISWVEFKQVLHVFVLSVPLWLQSDLEKLEALYKRKRLELHEKVVTFKDPIAEFSALLATRFEDVFDAFVFFDMDGDWQVTNKEMHAMLPKLQLNMTITDLDLTIAKIMRERNYKDEIFVDPKQFAKNLAWHPKPGTAPGLRRALDLAKERRTMVVQRAMALATSLGIENQDSPGYVPTVLPEDEVLVAQMQKQIEGMQNMQRDTKRIKSLFGIPMDGRLAMEEDDIQRRKDIARQDLQKRQMQQSDKGISVLLDRARLKRNAIVAEALTRSQDDVYARKLQGFKHAAPSEPPKVEELLKWAPKHEGHELSQLLQQVERMKAASHRFRSQGKRLFNCKIADLAMSTKLAHTRQEMFAHNSHMRKLAIDGEHQLILDGLDEAKLRRRQITENALKRAESLQADEWCKIEVPSPSVSQALRWFEDAAKRRVLIGNTGNGETDSKQATCGPISRSPSDGSAAPKPKTATSWGLMDANRIYASTELMTVALEYRFATVFDAWCFFDPDGTWDVSGKDFRKRASALRLPDEPVDIEGVIRKLDASCQDSIGPLDFVQALKWHELGAAIGDLRLSFDTAAKRRHLAGHVALKRSREANPARASTPAMTIVEEIAAEDDRRRREKMRKRAEKIEDRQQRLRDQLGPPQIFKDYARKRDWHRLLELEIESIRIQGAIQEMRTSAEKDVAGVNCEELSLRHHRQCSTLREIPTGERDDAACLIQRSLRALSAWKSKPQLQVLHKSRPSVFGFGRSEARDQVVLAIKKHSIDLNRFVAATVDEADDETPVDHDVWWNDRELTLRADLEEARDAVRAQVERALLTEIKISKNAMVLTTAEAVCSLLLAQDTQPVEWQAVTSVLANAGDFKEKLINFEPEDIEEAKFIYFSAKYSPILAVDFDVGQTAPAALPLCLWLRSLHALAVHARQKRRLEPEPAPADDGVVDQESYCDEDGRAAEENDSNFEFVLR